MDSDKLKKFTYSEEFRHQTEVRFVAKMDLSGRRRYIASVMEKRGVEAANKLKEGLEELWLNKKR